MNPRPLLFLTFALVLLLALGAPTALAAPAQGVQGNTTQLYGFEQSWLKATVVVVYGNQYGTGWWVNPSYVVTAAHVVGYQKGIVEVIRGSVKEQGTVIALDPNRDVAVIYVSNADKFDKTVLKLARQVPPYGSTIYVIGYPFELLQIAGSIERMSENPRVLESAITWHDPDRGLIELGGITDAGNSGGPVLDAWGNVIGLVSFALNGKAGTLYFATDVDNIKYVLEQAGVSWQEGSSGPLPEDPVVAGALAGAVSGFAMDVVLILLGLSLGLGLAMASRKRR